jgi:hypothetical protein
MSLPRQTRVWPWYSDLTQYVRVLNYCQLARGVLHKMVHYSSVPSCIEFVCVLMVES